MKPPDPTDGSVPHAAIDTHVHVFDPAHFPYESCRPYTPPSATVDALQAMQSRCGVARVVVVQPSVYGLDNNCLLQAIRSLGQRRARGVAVVDLDTTNEAQIEALHAGGIRGVRLNLKVQGAEARSRTARQLQRAAELLQRPDWHLQLHGPVDLLTTLDGHLQSFRVPIVLDHFGGLGSAGTGSSPAARALMLKLMATGKVYVKLSAPYRLSARPDFVDLQALATELICARPDRLLWGSDWPHTGGDGVRTGDAHQIEPFRHVDVRACLQALARWSGDRETFERILVGNAEKLYGFDPLQSVATAS